MTLLPGGSQNKKYTVSKAAVGVGPGAVACEAGAYTRPLLSSTKAIFCHKIHPEHPLIPHDTPYTPSKQPLNAPLSHRKR